MSTRSILLASFLDLKDRLPTKCSVMTVLETFVALVGRSMRALGLARIVVVESWANFNTFGVNDEVAVLVLLRLSFECITGDPRSCFHFGGLGFSLLLRCHDP